MSNPVKAVISGAALILGATAAEARTVAYSGRVETITVVVGTPTIVRFERPVKTVTNAAAFLVHAASEDSPDYATLAVEARSPRGQSLATFILADGTIVKTKLVAAPRSGPEGGDNVYDFKTDALADAPAGSADGSPGSDVKAVDLMKAMVRGDKVMGYEVRDAKKALTTGDRGVQAELVKIYAGGDFNGYVIRLTNRSADVPHQVDIRSLRLGEPNLAVLSQIDRRALGAAGSASNETFLRIVARPSSVYRDIVLPVAPIKKEKGGGS